MLEHLSLDQWQDFVESHAESTIFNHRRWLELLADQYNMKFEVVALRDGKDVLAAVPLLETKRLSGSRQLVSLPFSDVVPLLFRSREAAETLLRQLSLTAPAQYKTIVLRSDQILPAAKSVPVMVRHVIDLTSTLDEIQANFTQSARRNVGRAHQSGLQFETGVDHQFVDDFYRLHLLTRKKHGVPIQPRSFFQRLQTQLLEPGLGLIGRVTFGGQAVAAAVFLIQKEKFVFKYAASDAAFLSLRVNDLLVYQGIRAAKQKDCTSFDFGVSAKSQVGLRRFKAKWGAVESYVYDCFVRGVPQILTSESLSFRTLSRVLRIAPKCCCRAVGEMLYRYGG